MDRKTRPATEAPSADAEDDEAARLSALLLVDEAGVTRPATETPSSYAARMFGEEAARNYGVMGRLLHLRPAPGRRPESDHGRVPHHGPAQGEVDPPLQPVQVRRTCRHQGGHPHLLRGLRGLPRPPGNPRIVVVSSISSGQNIVQHDTPASILASALAGSRGWEWLPHHVTKDRHPRITGLPSAAKRDATVDGKYLAAPIGGEPGLVIVVDDFCTRGATLADIARAIRESNPGWKVQGASLAKAERAAYWKGELTNAHIPDSAGCHLARGPEGRVALLLRRNKASTHGLTRLRPYTPQTQKAPTWHERAGVPLAGRAFPSTKRKKGRILGQRGKDTALRHPPPVCCALAARPRTAAASAAPSAASCVSRPRRCAFVAAPCWRRLLRRLAGGAGLS